jgi:diguanylate cyclase (GGDEF)-like protein
MQAGLRTALAGYQERVDTAQSTAEGLARNRDFQTYLERLDFPALVSMLRGTPNLYVVAAGDAFHVGTRPALGASREVTVYSREGLIGTIKAYVPLETGLVDSLRDHSALAPADSLVVLNGTRIVAASPAAEGEVTLAPSRTQTIEVDGTKYRALVGPFLPDAQGARLAVLSPQSLIDAANATSRNRLLLGLLASLALVSLVAYFEGRSIVRTLRGLSDAAQAIARGRLSERVPVRGRDEFALLGAAFNDMANQLESRLAELEKERGRLRDAVARFGEALAATHDVDTLLGVIVEAAVEATGATGAQLRAEGGTIVESGDFTAEGERLELPLTAARETFGTLILVGTSFDEEQRMTASSLASHAAIALENARLHRIVERQALVDGLTGIANRRQCEEALTTEIARADRLGTPLTLLLADLDDFKRVNDEHGHATGDDVLREFAAVLRQTVRDSDLAGRWGGEEFLVLLPGSDAEGGAHLADRVRTAMQERSFLGRDGSVVNVTCSFGVAHHQLGGDERELFGAADRALYRAKREGKNRVEVDAPVRSF